MITRRRHQNQWEEPRGGGAALTIGSASFAIDAGSGHLYPTARETAIKPRDGGAGRLYPTDDTALTAARIRGAPSARLIIY